jgi:hypothetical protein
MMYIFSAAGATRELAMSHFLKNSDIADHGSRARFKLNGTQNCTAARTGEKWLYEARRRIAEYSL